jgi:hypothetical protein
MTILPLARLASISACASCSASKGKTGPRGIDSAPLSIFATYDASRSGQFPERDLQVQNARCESVQRRHLALTCSRRPDGERERLADEVCIQFSQWLGRAAVDPLVILQERFDPYPLLRARIIEVELRLAHLQKE